MAEARRVVSCFVWRSFGSDARVSIVCLLLAVGSVTFVTGQTAGDDELAPPPLRLISQDEKNKLAGESDVKRRTKLGLELMDARLKQAETFDSADNHDQMFTQLGAFHGLMDNMLEFLDHSDKDSNKVLNNYKRFEIGLRGFTGRLELIRRDLPIRYEHYLRTLIKNLRATRAKAIEPLFDDKVLPTKKPA